MHFKHANQDVNPRKNIAHITYTIFFYQVEMKAYPHSANYSTQATHEKPQNNSHPKVRTKAKECIEDNPAVDLLKKI